MSDENQNDPGLHNRSDQNAIPGQHTTEEEHRQYTYSISEEDRKKSFEMEDARWTRKKQLADWGKLGIMILVFWAWTLLVYLLEPGLR